MSWQHTEKYSRSLQVRAREMMNCSSLNLDCSVRGLQQTHWSRHRSWPGLERTVGMESGVTEWRGWDVSAWCTLGCCCHGRTVQWPAISQISYDLKLRRLSGLRFDDVTRDGGGRGTDAFLRFSSAKKGSGDDSQKASEISRVSWKTNVCAMIYFLLMLHWPTLSLINCEKTYPSANKSKNWLHLWIYVHLSSSLSG